MNEHEQPHLPPPSLWPLAFAVGIALILTGLVVSTLVAIVGAVIAVIFGFLWIRDVTRPVRTPVPEVEPERRAPATAAPVRADDPAAAMPIASEREVAAYPRSTFLSAATLGLGGVIGGLITVPVLGFAVLPSFTGDESDEVDLGPIENFPEGTFVIATYMEDEEVGEVTRRTLFIRNNGLTEEGQPSFTTLFSRCAHLGCPVQPNGLVDEEAQKTVNETIRLTPVNVTGFGCPCHGGQYDTEGNVISGPPVRALDRTEFSIRDGRLFLGKFYSVASVEGAGARARIKKYGRQVPGVHVDGPSAWLYPIEVP